MKKKIFGGIAVLTIATIAAWNVNVSSRTNGMSNVMLANVEALAGESVTGVTKCDGDGIIYCPLTNTSDYRTVATTQI